MDGKVLVLCGEKPTINEYGDRLDENSNLLEKIGEKYYNVADEEVEVDEHKRIISGMNLLNEISTDATKGDILFVNWDTVLSTDLLPLQEMIFYANSIEPIPPNVILGISKNPSIMKKAYGDRLMLIDSHNLRPQIDYSFQATNDFLQLFSRTLSKHMVATVLPAFPKSDSPEVNAVRSRFIESWRNINRIRSKRLNHDNEELIEVADPISYDNFAEVYERASAEMQKVISKPYWFEKTIHNKEYIEPGGRD